MSTITAILKPDADGTLHLPIPLEWRDQEIRVKAEMEPTNAPRPRAMAGVWKDLEPAAAPKPGCLKGFRMAPDFDEPLEDFKEYME